MPAEPRAEPGRSLESLMSRTPISLRSLFKSATSTDSVALGADEGAIPPPPRWDDLEDADVPMAAPTRINGRSRSLALGRRRAIAAPRRVA